MGYRELCVLTVLFRGQAAASHKIADGLTLPPAWQRRATCRHPSFRASTLGFGVTQKADQHFARTYPELMLFRSWNRLSSGGRFMPEGSKGKIFGRHRWKPDRQIHGRGRPAEGGRSGYAALERGRDGEPQRWRNPGNGHYGTFTPRRVYTYETRTCREYEQTIFINGHPETEHHLGFSLG